MLLFSIIYLNVLIFTVIKAQIFNTTNAASFITRSPIPKGFPRSLNRTRREDKLKHTAVCPELDRTDENPFIAVITTKNYGRLLCIGSILDEYHVLTARNCFDNSDARTLTIIAGYQSPYWGKNSQVKFADKIIRHKDKELAIIVLKKPFEFSEMVKPIRIMGPEKMNEQFNTSYNSPYSVIGFEVPEYLEQPSLIPRTISYHMKEEKYVNCEDKCYVFAATEKDLYFCSDAKSEFGWGGIGSPTIIPVQKEYVQIGILWNYKCTVPQKKPTEGPQQVSIFTGKRVTGGGGPGAGQLGSKNLFKKREDIPRTPNLHIRTDRFYKWIKANSYIDR